MSPVPADPRIARMNLIAGKMLVALHGGVIQMEDIGDLASEIADALAAVDAVLTPPDAANGRDLLRLALKRMVCDQCVWDIEHGRGLLSDEPIVCTHRTRAAVVSPSASDLFVDGEFTSHAGLQLPYKVDGDALTDADLDTLAAELARRLPPFNFVHGVPRGGIRLARALRNYRTAEDGLPVLIVDDVLTTGTSMEEAQKEWAGQGDRCIGAVIFARGPVPPWVTALFIETSAVVSPPDPAVKPSPRYGGVL